MRWRHSAQSPQTTEATRALLAVRDAADGEINLAGMYLWRGGFWVCEDTFEPIEGEFWWVYEAELLQNMRSAMAGL